MSQLTLEIPKPVIEAARKLADRESITIEELVCRMVSEAVRMDDYWEQRVARGRHVTRERFLEILNKAPDDPPVPGDELPDAVR